MCHIQVYYSGPLDIVNHLLNCRVVDVMGVVLINYVSSRSSKVLAAFDREESQQLCYKQVYLSLWLSVFQALRILASFQLV